MKHDKAHIQFPILPVLQEHGLDRVPSRDYGECTIRCPYHGEDRNPSARVNLDKQLFYCHTCGMAGDAINLLRQHEGLSYERAVERLGGVDGGITPKRGVRHFFE